MNGANREQTGLVRLIQELLTEAIRRSGKTRGAVAREIGTSLPAISRSLHKDNLTLRNVARILSATDFELQIELAPRGKAP